MTIRRALFLGLILGLVTTGAAGCSRLGEDYAPGINNPGYTPGHGRTSYLSAEVAAPSLGNTWAATTNGEPLRASTIGNG